jgi:hypothetical protein
VAHGVGERLRVRDGVGVAVGETPATSLTVTANSVLACVKEYASHVVHPVHFS